MIAEGVSRIVYAANEGMTEFEVPFRFIRAEHIKVFHDGSEEYVYGQDYHVNGVSENGGKSYTRGIVVFAEAPNRVIAIVRRVPVEQTTDYVVNGDLPAETLEGNLDYLTMAVQQMKEILNRCLKVDETSESDPAQVLKSILSIKDPEAISKAEKWAEEAQTGASSAAASAFSAENAATSAIGSSNAAAGSAANARAAETNAVASAGSAANAASNALTAADDIRTIAGQATLNHVTLAFGDWGPEGLYISYNEWTDADSLITVPQAIAEHDVDASAHSAAISAHDSSETAHSDIRNALTEHDEDEEAHADIRDDISDVDEKFNAGNIRSLANTRCWISNLVTPIAGTRSAVEHNLNLSPDEISRAIVEVRLKCVTANNGYGVGEYAQWGIRNCMVQPLLTANDVSVITGKTAPGIAIVNGETGDAVTSSSALSLSKWGYEFRIWY